jgi:type I restriction-modification system DNA methylase subunit
MARNNELEKTLWAADKLRSNMDAAEYKHIVFGLIFLKYISDAFSDLHEQLKAGEGEFEGADPEDADKYLAHNIFFVPEKARWQYLQDRAKQPEIGKWLDEAMEAIKKINPSLKGVLPKIYADPELNKQRLGELIDLIGTIGFNQSGHQAKDLLGRVYEYFLGQFADAEGKKGGQFYTPASIVKLLVAMLEPNQGRVYDGCCGSGGEGEIRKNMIEAGLIDCMVALPAQLFYNTMIPACLWFLARNKANGKFRNRSGEILLIDARKLGSMINRRNKEFSDDDIALITDTYHAWRNIDGLYEDKPGFCKAATLDEVRKNNHVLMPGRYVGAETEEDDGIPFDDKMKALTAKLADQFARGRELESLIRENLKGIGYEF